MSSLTYNNVALPYPDTVHFSQEAVADDSGTDHTLTKFDIMVQALVNINQLVMMAGDLAGGTAVTVTDIMNTVRFRLLERRRNLSFTFNGIDIIPDPAGVSGYADAKNGPIPQRCNITELTNTTFLITYHIIAHFWENNTVFNTSPHVRNNAGNPILSNRWSETQEIDECNYTRRTRMGTYVMRSDNVQGLTADNFRNVMCNLGVPPGYLRASSQYTVAPDGLAIQYQVVDQEVYLLPPVPAWKGRGYLKQSFSKNGSVGYADCWVELTGAKSTPQGDLIRAAFAVVGNRMIMLGFSTDYLFLSMEDLRVELFENKVECHTQVRTKTRSQDRRGLGSISIDLFGRDPKTGGLKYSAPSFTLRGNVPLLLQAAAYWDPSLTSTVLNNATGQMSAGLLVGQAGKQVEPRSPGGG